MQSWGGGGEGGYLGRRNLHRLGVFHHHHLGHPAVPPDHLDDPLTVAPVDKHQLEIGQGGGVRSEVSDRAGGAPSCVTASMRIP